MESSLFTGQTRRRRAGGMRDLPTVTQWQSGAQTQGSGINPASLPGIHAWNLSLLLGETVSPSLPTLTGPPEKQIQNLGLLAESSFP